MSQTDASAVRRAAATFLAALALQAGYLAFTLPGLEFPIAIHFHASGLAMERMALRPYLALQALMALLTPALLYLLLTRASGLPLWLLNLPADWLHPARQARRLARLREGALVLGVLMVAFAAGVHYLLLAANAHTPPFLPRQQAYMLLALFALALIAWRRWLGQRFSLR